MKVYLDQSNIICSLGNSLAEVWKNLCTGESGIISLKEKNLVPANFLVNAGAPYRFGSIPLTSENKIYEEYKILIESLINNLVPTEHEIDAIVLASNINSAEKALAEKDISEDVCIELLKLAMSEKGFRFAPDLKVISIYNTCISGLSALRLGADFVQLMNKKQVVIITLEPRMRMWSLMPLDFLNMLSRQQDIGRSSVSFSIDREGFVKGDGCAIAILGAKRSDQDQVEIVGVSERNDFYRLTDPEEAGRGLEAAIRDVAGRAKINLSEIDYVSAHAPGTKRYDVIEAGVLARIFNTNKNVKITALKTQIGHTNISSGLIATIIAAKSIREKMITPVLGLTLDPAIEKLNFVTNVKQENLKLVLVNSSGIGGHNASALLRSE